MLTCKKCGKKQNNILIDLKQYPRTSESDLLTIVTEWECEKCNIIYCYKFNIQNDDFDKLISKIFQGDETIFNEENSINILHEKNLSNISSKIYNELLDEIRCVNEDNESYSKKKKKKKKK